MNKRRKNTLLGLLICKCALWIYIQIHSLRSLTNALNVKLLLLLSAVSSSTSDKTSKCTWASKGCWILFLASLCFYFVCFHPSFRICSVITMNRTFLRPRGGELKFRIQVHWPIWTKYTKYWPPAVPVVSGLIMSLVFAFGPRPQLKFGPSWTIFIVPPNFRKFAQSADHKIL